MILELEEDESYIFDEIFSLLQQYPTLEKVRPNRKTKISISGLDIYPIRRKVFLNQQELSLTVKEYEILLLLVSNAGRVLTYSQIYESVWNEIPNGNERHTIGFHICNLREKFFKTSHTLPFTIQSIREVGYCFNISSE